MEPAIATVSVNPLIAFASAPRPAERVALNSYKAEQVGATEDDFSHLTRDLIAVRDRRDRAAFGRLFDHFAPRLKAMMLRGGLRDGTAEDVVQDVLLTVWHKSAQFDPHRADAAAWVFSIARNRRTDLARRRPLAQLEELPEIESLEPDAAQLLGLQQEARHLHEALAHLAPEQAEALRAAYFDGIPHSRISEITGLPWGPSSPASASALSASGTS